MLNRPQCSLNVLDQRTSILNLLFHFLLFPMKEGLTAYIFVYFSLAMFFSFSFLSDAHVSLGPSLFQALMLYLSN